MRMTVADTGPLAYPNQVLSGQTRSFHSRFRQAQLGIDLLLADDFWALVLDRWKNIQDRSALFGAPLASTIRPVARLQRNKSPVDSA